jgi:hypothetical protein
MEALVQVLLTVVLQRPPQAAVLVQQAPTSPAPARCGGVGAPASTEQKRPPVQLQVRPVGSPGKRPKVGLALVLHRALAAPLAGGTWVLQVR